MCEIRLARFLSLTLKLARLSLLILKQCTHGGTMKTTGFRSLSYYVCIVP